MGEKERCKSGGGADESQPVGSGIIESTVSIWKHVQCPYKVNRILEDWLQKQVLAV